MYKQKDINHILFHNRSEKLVENFLPKLEYAEVSKADIILTYCSRSFQIEDEDEFSKSEFDLEQEDIVFTKEEFQYIKEYVISSNIIENSEEHNFLTSRGISNDLINKYQLKSLSNISDKNVLDRIGATTHGILRNILGDGISGGGIIIPLILNDVFENCVIRRIDDENKMKYTTAIPSVSIWGDIKEGSDIWLTEGLFDRIFMLENGFDNVISCSTPGLSSIQLLLIINSNPSSVNIWSDKDQSGLKHSYIIKKFLKFYNIPCEIYISEEYKDPNDHFLNGLGKDDIYPIQLKKEDVYKYKKNKNKSFLEYLKKRKYT